MKDFVLSSSELLDLAAQEECDYNEVYNINIRGIDFLNRKYS